MHLTPMATRAGGVRPCNTYAISGPDHGLGWELQKQKGDGSGCVENGQVQIKGAAASP